MLGAEPGAGDTYFKQHKSLFEQIELIFLRKINWINRKKNKIQYNKEEIGGQDKNVEQNGVLHR